VSTWNKKQISKSEIEELEKKYGVDSLTASIMARRNIIAGHDVLYLMQDNLRYQHSPFSFTDMEDAVDRILDAKDDNAKVLIFGDRDVDGVSATTVLYDCLSAMGIDVRYRLPQGDDAYGLSIAAVDDFAKEYGSLIITVDCGISNNAEIAHAAELGMDIIVVDHHNPPAELPSPAIIIDPKLPDSGYPFKNISGCAVVYKLVSALRFAASDLYKQEVCLLNVRPVNEAYTIECIKVRNLVPTARMEETIVPGTVSITQTRLPSFLSGQQIFVWDSKTIGKLLTDAFGSGVEFNFMDIRPDVVKIIPSLPPEISLLRLKDSSQLAKYGDHPATEIGGFYNIFVTYTQLKLKAAFPANEDAEEKDLQLVALAALADIMPVKDENRIFVRNGLASINASRIRPGLVELMSHLNLLGKRVSAINLGWDVVSNLNAAGRLGHAEYAAELFLSQNATERDAVAQKILDLNTERKQLSSDAWAYAANQAETSIPLHHNNLCVVIDERINHGVSGILAGRLVSQYHVPSMAVTFVGNTAFGSMRSCRGYDITTFLDQLSDLFINHGGHNYAAGFSFTRDKLAQFEERVTSLSSIIELTALENDTIEIDAEIPPQFLTAKLLAVTDLFEPFGEENPELVFMTKGLPIIDALVMGKGEKQHLKLTLNSGTYKWPALFWNEAERLHRDFEIGDKVDILYHLSRNSYNGVETPQLILIDVKKSDSSN